MTILQPVERAGFPDLRFEQPLWDAGCPFVAGIDEAGRGALAGPVMAAAVILPSDPALPHRLWGVRDSKQMTPAQRLVWAQAIRQHALAWAVGTALASEIDQWGIVPATCLAMQRALHDLALAPGYLLLDYLRLPEVDLPQTALVKGDQRSLSIASASVLAKTARDALMQRLEGEYPGYGLASHKGYGTAEHRAALLRLGPSSIHRLTFQPVRAVVQQEV